LSGLPAGLLRLPAAVLERLHALGLGTIRDVSQLPRETLAGRFDSILTRRLDEALGRRPELFVVERLREPLTAVREWDEPLDDRLAVALVCRQMLRALLSGADHPGAGLQELEGELRTEAGAVRLEIRLVEPSRDEGHLAQLVELQLERCTWPGGVVAIRWTAPRLGRLPEVQRDWFADDSEADGSRQVDALVDRLSSRLGNGAVLRAEVLPDAQPERAVRLVPSTEARPARADDYSMPADQARCRPFRLLGTPRPIAVVSAVPDGPPARVTWEQRDHRVVRCWGPERIATGWWRALDVQRDYYRAEWEDGTHAWIFRDRRDGRWFLHGFFE
jgi:protein ImuB